MAYASQTQVPRKPLDAATTERILDDFYRDGFVLIPGVLTPEEVEQLKAGIDHVADHPEIYTPRANLYAPWIALRLFETNQLFRDLLVREPIISLAEAVLGPQCHLMAQNAVRNAPGTAIDRFHVDDELEFPCPPSMDRHDARYRLPVFRMTVQMMLTDCESVEYGPSQYVATSHYSGREPNDLFEPEFEGRKPVSIFCKAGDIYLHNGQCWHRGGMNTSDRVRYLLQNAYCRRWVAQRFYPFLNYRMPDQVLEGADERLRRVLGEHPKGPYG